MLMRCRMSRHGCCQVRGYLLQIEEQVDMFKRQLVAQPHMGHRVAYAVCLMMLPPWLSHRGAGQPSLIFMLFKVFGHDVRQNGEALQCAYRLYEAPRPPPTVMCLLVHCIPRG